MNDCHHPRPCLTLLRVTAWLLLGLLPVRVALADTWTETKKTVYVIRADFPDLPGEAISLAELTTRFNLTVSNALFEMSYGKTWVEATVSPMVVRLPGTTNSYAPNNWSALHTDAVAAFNAQNPGVNLANYNVVAIAFKYIGMSTAGRVDFTPAYRRMWLTDTLRPGASGGGLSPEVITHEMGHVYGLGHANARVGPLVGGTVLDAGDPFDTLGRGYLELAAAHFNLFAKSRLNWLTPSQWTNVTTSGTYRIYRLDHPATSATASRGLRIGKSDPDDYYWVGYRRAFTSNPSLSNGANLLWSTSGYSLLLDTTPGSSSDMFLDFQDSALGIGQPYTDPVANVRITPLSNGGAPPNEWLDVRVEFGIVPVIQATSTTLTAEGCQPGNGAPDPGETVIVNLGLTTLTAATANLVATLLPGNGVVSPSAPRNYGAVLAGATTTRAFTFTATGQCGDNLALTFQLQDGPSNLGTVTTSLGLGALTTALSQSFDSVARPALPASWNTTLTGAGAAWATIATGSTPPHSAFASNPADTSDNSLTSPSIAIATTSARLTFRHSYSTESRRDGGVMEVAIGGGNFTDILSAGGSFAANGYVGIIETFNSSNPLRNRNAWHGNSGGFLTTQVNLPASAAGQMIRLRWRMGCDQSVGGVGWYVDDISVTEGASCCTGGGGLPPTVTTEAATSPAATAATLNGSANPNGAAAIGYFQWGATTSYGQTTTATALGSGSVAVPFSRVLGGLTPGQTYHYRAVASNAAGIVHGIDMMFVTPTAGDCLPSITVTSANDSGPGSLRQALADVCPGGTITFAPALNGQAIVLTSGELVLRTNVTILGPGANLLAISGNNMSRVFSIDRNAITLLAGLTLSNGNGAGRVVDGLTGTGGGIVNQGTLTLSNATLTGNTSLGYHGRGGAIHHGGEGATLTILNCTLSFNSARVQGGAIENTIGTVTIRNSTLNGNSALVDGGGINMTRGTVTIENSTLSGNSVQRDAGGIFNGNGRLSAVHTTITGNRANRGGGLVSVGTMSELRTRLTNCIVAGNFRDGGNASDVAGILHSPDHNLIGEAIESLGVTHGVNGNIVGDPGGGLLPITSILNPELNLNGGATRTHALVRFSPAIDAGTNGVIAGLTFDQRGPGFPRLRGVTVDIGAYEAPTDPPPPAIIVCPSSFHRITAQVPIPVTWTTSMACTPPSGSLFGPGATLVTCTNAGDPVSCSFSVVVVHTPPLLGPLTKVPTGMQLRVLDEPNRSLQIQWNNTPGPGGWNLLTTGTTDAGGFLQYIDTGVNGVPQRFYRTVRP